MTNASSRPRSSTTAVTTAEARGLTAAPVGAVTARNRGSRSPWNGGLHFQTIWTSGSSRQAGLAPGITLALIIIAGIQFGLLASIGFMVFHAIGSVLNSMREMRSMLAGNPPNPWPGRILSWTISFLLVGWLSGGFQ